MGIRPWRAQPAFGAGLDIGSTCVRLVELARRRARFQLVRCASRPLPEEAVVDGQVERVDLVAGCVRQLWRDSGAQARTVALALPGACVIQRPVTAPQGLDEEELEALVEAEAGRALPFARDQVSLDFALRAAHGREDVELVLAAARRDQVEQRVAMARGAGLHVTVVDVEAGAACAALLRTQPAGDAPVALVHIGARATHLAVLQDEEVIYEREHPPGGAALEQALARNAAMPLAQAQQLVRSNQWAQPELARLRRAALAATTQDVLRALQLLYAAGSCTRISRLYLAGGGALLPGLPQALAQATHIATCLAAPFAGMDGHAPALAGGADYLVACGLALRGLDPCCA